MRDAGQEPLANVSLELIRSARTQLESSLTTIIGNHMTWGGKGIANDFCISGMIWGLILWIVRKWRVL